MTEPTQMRVQYDVPIEMDDGLLLRADVFLPPAEGRYPVILTHGPYGKNYHFRDRGAGPWKVLRRDYPEIFERTSGSYASWETVDPEKWVPDGYACVRVDSRGAGRSPGYLDILSRRETRDYARCVEWAGRQPWSNGRVGLLGISYFAINQWQVAALRPRHLAAICPWEGGVDHYRDFSRQGGILNSFVTNWYARSVLSVQHGTGQRGPRDSNTGELVAGPETLPEERLAANREDHSRELRARPLDDDYYRERSADIPAITVPVLSAANWSHPLHTREVTFDALGDGVTLRTDPLAEDTEVTGPAAAKLFVASSTEDADLFVVLRVFAPDGTDVMFRTAIDPNGTVAFGWLRASHRKLDPARTVPHRPWHTHDERQPLTPGETVECDVEIWPTSVLVPAGYRIGVTILGRDFAFPGDGPWPQRGDIQLRGSGIFLHNDPRDRPVSVYGGQTTLSTHPDRPSYLLLPVIPAADPSNQGEPW